MCILHVYLRFLLCVDHSYSPCLASLLGDTGNAHSPIHGFAYDSYPIYGPYQAANTLAKSCWKPRDYSATSPTGCSDGTRSCQLVDMYNYTLGTVATTQIGPNTTTTVKSLSSNVINTVSGIYYEDYYYDASCAAQGGEYLNEFNGHDHDNMGFHYHVTIDSSSRPTFPYIIGPKYYGCIRNGKCSTSITSSGSSSGTSTCGTSSAVPLASQQCKSYVFQTNITFPDDTSTSSTSSVSSSSSESVLSTMEIALIVGLGGGVIALIVLASVTWYAFFSTSASTAAAAVGDKVAYAGIEPGCDIVAGASGQGVEMAESVIVVEGSAGNF